MSNFLNNSLNYKYFGCIAALALGLASCEQKQALPVSDNPIPTSSAQPDRYYLNAQPSTKEVIEQLDTKTITRMDMLKDQQAADYAHDASISKVVLVQTK